MTDPIELIKMSVADFTAATAARQPTPGGGSVAGVVGALATALGEMTLNFSRGKKHLAEHAEVHDHLAGRLERAREMFQDLVADDVGAYSLFREAVDMPDGPEKDRTKQLALEASIEVPRQTATLCVAVLEDLRELTPRCNRYLISDLVAAGVLAAATASLCDFNVRVNARNLDPVDAEPYRTASAADRQKARRIAEDIEQAALPHIDG